MKVALTTMEAALLKARGYTMPEAVQVGFATPEFRVFVVKGEDRVETLGRTPEQAAAKFVRMVILPDQR